MSQESLPLHKEFGIFLFGWTGAVTIVVALFYASPPPYHRLPDNLIMAIAYDWAIGMLMGVCALVAIWAGVKIIEEVIAPIVEQIRRALL